MERVQITCLQRQGTGKKETKKVRGQQYVPAIVYGKDINLAVKIPHASMKMLRSIHYSESTVIDMRIEGSLEQPSLSVLIKEVQYHPLTEEVIHIDFLKVSLDEKIHVRVPVELTGECKGVKEGGILEHHLWEVSIEAFPLDIPEKIVLDISELEIGHSLHIKDIVVSSEVKLLDPSGETIVTVVAKSEEEEEAPEEVAEEAQEPQVIKEKEEKGEKPEEKREGK